MNTHLLTSSRTTFDSKYIGTCRTISFWINLFPRRVNVKLYNISFSPRSWHGLTCSHTLAEAQAVMWGYITHTCCILWSCSTLVLKSDDTYAACYQGTSHGRVKTSSIPGACPSNFGSVLSKNKAGALLVYYLPNKEAETNYTWDSFSAKTCLLFCRQRSSIFWVVWFHQGHKQSQPSLLHKASSVHFTAAPHFISVNLTLSS
jgi:hypothetical protein